MPFDQSDQNGGGGGGGCATCSGLGLVPEYVPFIRADLASESPHAALIALPRPCPDCQPMIMPGLCSRCFGARQLPIYLTARCTDVSYSMTTIVTRDCTCVR